MGSEETVGDEWVDLDPPISARSVGRFAAGMIRVAALLSAVAVVAGGASSVLVDRISSGEQPGAADAPKVLVADGSGSVASRRGG